MSYFWNELVFSFDFLQDDSNFFYIKKKALNFVMQVQYLLLVDDTDAALSFLILMLFTDAICCLRPLGMSFSSGLGYKRKNS